MLSQMSDMPIHLCLQLTCEITDGTWERFTLNEDHPPF